YLSSFFSLATLIFVPTLIGLTLGLTLARGPAFLLLAPLAAAFLMMVTALTYQFQGWLAALMANKRRRQTIMVLLTIGAFLLCQLPNMFNFLRWTDGPKLDQHAVELNAERDALAAQAAAGKITQAEYDTRLRQLEEDFHARSEARHQESERALRH